MMYHRLSWLYCIVTIVSSFELCTLRTSRIRSTTTTTTTSTCRNAYCRSLHRINNRSSLLKTSPTDDNAIAAPPTTTTTTTNLAPTIDIKKEGVKIFGRLAEKYIALDSSGGNCCYSGCTGCEYRLPDGGYKMADQTAARPKWIPHYDVRVMNANQQHCTKWNINLFQNPNVTAITKDEFVNGIINLEFIPPLGGPYMSASTAQITDTTLVEQIFDIIAEDKVKLTKFKMSVRIKQLSNGEEGMTWQAFERMIETIA